MFFKKKNNFLKLFIAAGLFVSAGIFVLFGCASAPKTLDSSVASPQVIVNPESVSLGVASLLGEKIVFEGAGFEPEDSVFITLFGPNETEAIVADSKVGSDGKFTATIGTLAKVTGILKLKVIQPRKRWEIGKSI